MIIRKINDLFYVTPVIAWWDDEDQDDVFVLCFAWLNWSLEIPFLGCV